MIAIPPSFWLDTNELKFPELNQALKEPNGLIGIGGDLSSERLIHAYSSGIFLGMERMNQFCGIHQTLEW